MDKGEKKMDKLMKGAYFICFYCESDQFLMGCKLPPINRMCNKCAEKLKAILSPNK